MSADIGWEEYQQICDKLSRANARVSELRASNALYPTLLKEEYDRAAADWKSRVEALAAELAKVQRDRDRLEECRAEAERERDEDWRRANAAEAELAKAREALREISTLVPRLSLIGRIASAALAGQKP